VAHRGSTRWAAGIGFITLFSLALAAGVAWAAPGALDRSFSSDGLVTTDVGLSSFGVNGSVVDAKGRLLVVGQSQGAASTDFTLVRYTPQGGLDPSFGGGGVVRTDVLGINKGDTANGVAIDSSGRILVAGQVSDGTSLNFAVVRYTAAGQLDTSFSAGDGSNGVALFDLGNDNLADNATAVTIDRSGRIVAAGYQSFSLTQADFAVVRLLSSGAPDPSFNGTGIQTLSVPGGGNTNDRPSGATIDASNRIVLAGGTGSGFAADNIAVMRFLPSGAKDTSFDGDGVKVLDLTPGQGDSAFAAASVGNKIVLAGYSQNAARTVVLRLTPAGALDSSFSGDGQATPAFPGTYSEGDGLVIDPDGRVLVSGAAQEANGGNGEFAASRFLPNGSLDRSFSGDGRLAFPIPTSAESEAYSAARDPRSGLIYLSGYAYIGHNQFAVARIEGVHRCGGKIPTITGTDHKDKLKGTKGRDVIWGGGGPDTIRGLAGRDVLCGGRGRDRLIGGKGRDRLIGGPGRDVQVQ
jgi:uncharacterized delta-60 repeat protein